MKRFERSQQTAAMFVNFRCGGMSEEEAVQAVSDEMKLDRRLIRKRLRAAGVMAPAKIGTGHLPPVHEPIDGSLADLRGEKAAESGSAFFLNALKSAGMVERPGEPRSRLSFEEQLAAVEAGRVGLVPNVRLTKVETRSLVGGSFQQ